MNDARLSQDLFPGFQVRDIETDAGVRIHARVGGDGPPLLLLHGHPQTHALWHKVAPALAERFTLVLCDLRGYGDSSKPAGEADHANYGKRVMARDMRRVMQALGHERFAVMAHDRGARVAHRLAADHGEAVRRVVLLDIAPTLAMYEQTSETFARAYWHWFFLIQPAPLPECLIEAVSARPSRVDENASRVKDRVHVRNRWTRWKATNPLPGAATAPS
jgi:Predicted hydrolases or acyltransferases (alpha/beta hydrolase superfamily)